MYKNDRIWMILRKIIFLSLKILSSYHFKKLVQSNV